MTPASTTPAPQTRPLRRVSTLDLARVPSRNVPSSEASQNSLTSASVPPPATSGSRLSGSLVDWLK